jgi:redox-sensitive bicupin YhaK (pirin superfamily)
MVIQYNHGVVFLAMSIQTALQPTLQIIDAKAMQEGQGAEVRRLFPLPRGLMNFDPFVLWDHFFLQAGTGFPEHPHRGFEAITYLFEGKMQHRDNLGNDSTVSAGGAQRFTAGQGIVHSEMPDAEGQTSGIQLWINLPKRLKQIEPAYQAVNAEDIPETTINGGIVRDIVGDTSPLQIKTPLTYLDIQLKPTASYELPLPAGYRGIVYIVQGETHILGKQVNTGQACLFDQIELLDIQADTDARIMLAAGQPHGEPIHQYGPYVD